MKKELKYNNILVTDFDGILSDGMYEDAHGNIWKHICCGNKEAVQFAHEQDIEVICISSQSREQGKQITQNVCTRLGIEVYFCSTAEKLNTWQKICQWYSTPPNKRAFVGDDLNDLFLAPAFDLMMAPKKSIPMIDKANAFLSTTLQTQYFLHHRPLTSDKPLLEAVITFANFIYNGK